MDLDDRHIFCKDAQLTSAMLFDGADFTEVVSVVKSIRVTPNPEISDSTMISVHTLD